MSNVPIAGCNFKSPRHFLLKGGCTKDRTNGCALQTDVMSRTAGALEQHCCMHKQDYFISRGSDRLPRFGCLGEASTDFLRLNKTIKSSLDLQWYS